MRTRNSLLYGLMVLLVFVVASFMFYPAILPALFLGGTLSVAAIAMISGIRAGLLSYLIVSLVLFALPLREVMGLREMLLRFLGFTCSSLILAFLSDKIRQYELQVASKEKKLQIISDSLTDVLITIDHHSKITFVNPAIEKVFGYTPEELLGKSLTHLIPENLKKKHLEGFQNYIKTKKKTINWKAVEVRGLKKDGTEFPIEISFGEFEDKHGRYFSAIIRDITLRREFDKKMSLLGAIVESSDDAIIAKNIDGVITSWNKGAENIFGYSAAEIVGKNIRLLFPEDKSSEEDEILSKLLLGEKISHFETFRKKKDGTVFPVSLTVSPIKDSTGKVVGASKILRDISLRWNYERNLKESDERYRSFVQNSSEGIWRAELKEPMSIDLPVEQQVEFILKNAYFAECNQAMSEMYDYHNPQDIIGKPITFLLPPNQSTKDYLTSFVNNNYSLEDVESQEIGAKGQTLYFTNSLVAIVDNDKITRAWGVQRDITERKLQAMQIERSNERYKAFIENSEEAIWMVEYKPPVDISLPVEQQIDDLFSNGYIAEVNSKMLEFYQFSSQDRVLGKPSAIISQRTPQAEKFIRQFIDSDYYISNHESYSVDENGNPRYVSTSYRGIVQNGKLVRGWTIQMETTEKKLQEQELQKSEERYKTFIETSDDAIWRVEFHQSIDTSFPVNVQVEKFFGEGYIAEANEATYPIMDISKDLRIINKPLNELQLRSHGDTEFMKKFVENGYSLSDYESVREENGKKIYHLSSMKGIIENGQWVRAWTVRKNITPQKEYAIERERLLDEAEKAKESLQVASAEKDRFLANLSHELRTPLVSILGYSAMLLETSPESEVAKQMITTIHKNAKLQVQLIEDLLDLSKIISGKIELKKDKFLVSELAKDCVDTFRKQAEDKGLKIIEKYEDCEFYGDRKRLSQVFLNLLSNAIKFTEKGEVTFSVHCSYQHLTVKITDTGVGIDPKNFPLLFQSFKQLDSSSTRNKQGLGLGLSIVKNIVELHEGKVGVESKLGEGSEFTVYLPMPSSVIVENQEQIHVTPSVTFDGIKMLLVEDDPDSAGFIKYLYEQKGATVDWVDSAKKAREMITKSKYDLYIFDLSMPEEDGISLIKGVRAAKDTTKSVALTAFADTYYEKKALEAGFDMFLKKPSSLPELLSVIKLIR